MKKVYLVLVIFLLIQNIKPHNDDDYITEEDIKREIDKSTITYGSALKLENVLSKHLLYSNKYTWGTGSQLQIITGIRERDNPEAIWVIKEKHDEVMKDTGVPVMCNDIIRLEHSYTGKNLHSHDFRSWITDSQEACGFGQDGNGDVNDNFKIICYNSTGIITGATEFFLQHVATNAYLYINIKSSLFDERNCRNCPVMYQREVSLTSSKDRQCLWKVVGGLIFKERQDEVAKNQDDDDN